MSMILVIGVFLIAIGVFLNSLDEKNFRPHNVITCGDLDLPHNWGYDKKNVMFCRHCGQVAGQNNNKEG